MKCSLLLVSAGLGDSIHRYDCWDKYAQPLVPVSLRETIVRYYLAASLFGDLFILVGQRRSGRYDSRLSLLTSRTRDEAEISI